MVECCGSVAHHLSVRYKLNWKKYVNIIESIGLLVVTPVSIVTSITYLAKKFVDTLFATKQKQYELELQRKLDNELQSFKEQRENESLRNRVKIEGLYEWQADTIISLYQKTVIIERDLHMIVNFAYGNSELYKNFENSYNDIRFYFNQNRILLPESTEVLVEALLNDAFSSYSKHKSSEETISQLRDIDFSVLQETFKDKEDSTELSRAFQQIKVELTIALRNLIGVSVL